MKSRGFSKMGIAVVAVTGLIFGIVVFLATPNSATKTEFDRIVNGKSEMSAEGNDIVTQADLAGFPDTLKRYFDYCGYIGTPKVQYMKATLRNVDFVMSKTKTIRIDYKQFNLAKRPERFALIVSSLSGIPFEGLDSFEGGNGSMKGKLAKVIPLFDQRGESMDRACLVTWLAECLMVPGAAFQDFITWEAIDDTNVRAVIEWQGIKAGGVFTFSERGEVVSFRTSDRIAVDMDGKETAADWSAYFREYHLVKGILQPRIIQSVWHYKNGDCIYFNENESSVEFSYI